MTNILETINTLKASLSPEDLKKLSQELNASSITKTREQRQQAFENACMSQERDLKDITMTQLSELIESDKLSLFQYDYLVDEVDLDKMTPEAKTKLTRMQNEIRFLLAYYQLIDY
jgi:hypothetical protein